MTRKFNQETRIFADVDDVIPSTTFADWTVDTIPDGWTQLGTTVDPTRRNSDANPGWNILTESGLMGGDLESVLTIGVRYEYTIVVVATSNTLRFEEGSAVQIESSMTTGTYTGKFIATGTDIRIKRELGAATDVTITSMSVKPDR